MTIVDLKRRISSNEILPIHIFYGSEYKVMNIYIEMIEKLVGKSKCFENVRSAASLLGLESSIISLPDVMVVYDDSEFLTDSDTWDTVLQDLSDSGKVLILKYNKLDTRSKFAKHFSDNITEFDRLSDSVLKKYIKNEVKINDKMCDCLIDACSGSYGRILLEIDKVKNLLESNSSLKNDEDAFRFLYNSRGISFDERGEAFDLIDCFMRRDYDSYGYLSEESKERGDNPILIISLLATAVKALLQVKTCTGKDIASCTGLNTYQIKNAKKYINNYSSKELIRFMKILYYCDKSIKTGILNPDMVVDYIAINVL